jgi:hypothetical protein
MMDRTSKRLSRALVLDRSIEFLAQVNDEAQREAQQKQQSQQSWEQQHSFSRDGDRQTLSTVDLLRDEKLDPSTSDPNIPPPDRGSRAIFFMISAFIIEAIMWGTYSIPRRSFFNTTIRIARQSLSVKRIGVASWEHLMQPQPGRCVRFHDSFPNLHEIPPLHKICRHFAN